MSVASRKLLLWFSWPFYRHKRITRDHLLTFAEALSLYYLDKKTLAVNILEMFYSYLELFTTLCCITLSYYMRHKTYWLLMVSSHNRYQSSRVVITENETPLAGTVMILVGPRAAKRIAPFPSLSFLPKVMNGE